jgi:hypothetical protein
MQNCKSEYQIRQVLKEHPGLSYDEQSQMFSGTLIIDEDDYYWVLIDLKTFPKRFPIVKETHERIKSHVDFHKYSDDSLCLTTPAKEQILLRKGMIKTISQFIDKIVLPFFQNNSFRELNGCYKKGEYSHGLPGVFESYLEILGISDIGLAVDILIKHLNGMSFSVNDSCFCGSSKKFKDCHKHRFDDLKFIDRNTIETDLSLLRSYVRELKL